MYRDFNTCCFTLIKSDRPDFSSFPQHNSKVFGFFEITALFSIIKIIEIVPDVINWIYIHYSRLKILLKQFATKIGDIGNNISV